MATLTRTQVFEAIHTVGGLLPADMLLRISAGKEVEGCRSADYGVVGSRSVRDDAERHWDYLRSVWSELRDRLPAAPEADTPPDPTGAAITQWLEPLFAELGFARLAATGAAGIRADDGGRTFPISHHWRHVPIHLAPWNAGLDRRPSGAGAVPPQSMLQECLNRTDANLWGVLTNGRQLRLLRDSNALATASYVEFDLEAIFDGELFSEFVLLYRLLHVSRFEVDEGAPPSGCWLEKWRVEAIASGTRALEHHRKGVQAAITALGTGFLKHPANAHLRENLNVHEFHVALLRLVYRMIFLFVAEDRSALHPDTTPEPARLRYAAYFSSRRLRQQALRRRGTAHSDRYQALRFVLDALGDEHGRPELGLPALGGLFDDTDADAPLRGLSLSNLYLLDAVRHLARVRDAGSARWRQVDYRNIGSEELGSIYESLLDLVPEHSAVDRTFDLAVRPGNERKKTGSYYTPASLIETLLDSTLDPVIDDAQKRGEQRASAAGQPDPTETVVEELLSITVCDPACGSGHFLVAAARRIAKRIAAVRERNPEPTLDAIRHALHDVVARCVYGVDLNPMAVELAKVSLWLEALEPGRPLGFLDAHLKHGNALIGATPVLLRDGIPSKAFKPVEGDDPRLARSLEQRNDQELSGQTGLFDLDSNVRVANTGFAAGLRKIIAAPAETLPDVRRQAAAYRDWERADDYVHAKHVADAWCAAFMWHKTADAPPAITDEVFRALQDPTAAAASQATHDEIVRLRERYDFFHWHLEFPDIFPVPADGGAGVDSATGWAGGFSCVLGNPPWDKIDFEDKKYFSVVEPAIAAVSGTARRTRIAQWAEENPAAGERYYAERRKVKSTFLFAGSSGAFPLCGKGLTVKGVNSLQTDQLFAERFVGIVAATGRAGCIIPTAIATGAGGQFLFSSLTQRGAVRHLYDLENRKLIFQGVDATYKFCLLSLVGRELREPAAEFAFFLLDVADLDDAAKTYALNAEEITLINPNTGTLPVFRTRRDADLAVAIYRRIPVLWNERGLDGNHWSIAIKRLFDMTDDSDLFRTRERLEAEGWELHGNVFVRGKQRVVPLYEGKMAYLFDHRWNHFTGTGNEERRFLRPDEKANPAVMSMPRYWVADEGLIEVVRRNEPAKVPGVAERLKNVGWERDWVCGWRDVTKAVNERTAIPAFLPRSAVGHTFSLMLPRVVPALVAALITSQSSLVFDFVSRQKVGDRHMALMTWKQLPVPAPETMERHVPFVVPRVLELVYTAYDMAGLARDLGDNGAPFRWDEKRRAQIRAELDAYFFYLYGIGRDDVDYILETFQTETGGLKHNEIAKYSTYRTKDMVLAEYDRMAPSGVDLDRPLVDGENFTSILNPLPGHGPRHPPAPELAYTRTDGEGD